MSVRLLALAAQVLLFSGPGTATADGGAKALQPRLSFGPGVGLVVPSSPPLAAVIGEATLTLSPFGPNLSAGYIGRGGSSYLYGEVSGWWFVTGGVGLGRWLGRPGTLGEHLFVGVPLPICGVDWGGGSGRTVACGFAFHGGLPRVQFYFEPAYRRYFGATTGGQIEVLFKVSVGLRRL